MYEESAYEDEMNDIRRDIQEDCQEYGENMHRSDEDGWFYDDGDAQWSAE